MSEKIVIAGFDDSHDSYGGFESGARGVVGMSFEPSLTANKASDAIGFLGSGSVAHLVGDREIINTGGVVTMNIPMNRSRDEVQAPIESAVAKAHTIYGTMTHVIMLTFTRYDMENAEHAKDNVIAELTTIFEQVKALWTPGSALSARQVLEAIANN